MSSKKPVITAVALMLLFLAPIIVSRFWVPKSFVNNGDLIDPPVSWLNLQWQAEGQPIDPSAILTEKWRLLLVADGACDALCEKGLYNIRQIRLTQGRHMDEVALSWLLSDGQYNKDPKIQSEYDLVEQITLASEDFSKTEDSIIVAGVKLEKDSLYLIDPLGNVMMHFPKELDPGLIKKDLKRLIRVYNSVSVYNKPS